MDAWDVFIGDHFIGAVQARTKADAITVADFQFGKHLEGIVTVHRRADGRVPSHPVADPLPRSVVAKFVPKRKNRVLRRETV